MPWFCLQTSARRNSIPIDTLTFDYGIVNLEEREINSGPKEGVYVKGLFLEGKNHLQHQLLMSVAVFDLIIA